MRGAASGDNGNHSGSQPGVGQYLDEQPITTIQGALDIHMYDIARVALKIDLNDNWSVTPTIMGQRQKSNGVFAQESGLPELSVAHWHPENSDDRWAQAALTVEGKIGNFDMTLASSYLKRNVDVNSDYSDYAFFYDTLNGSGAYFTDNAGDLINPSQFIRGKDHYTKWSHELRFSTPKENKVHAIFGVFVQRQTHDIEQAYDINALADESAVTGWPDTFWLTKQFRVDRDSAIFGEVTWDVTDKFALTGGARYFKYENSLEGFFGFGLTNPFESSTGEGSCFGTNHFEDGPCTNLDKTVKDNDSTFKLNATYHITDAAMVYATYSEGFRPGGVNRRGTFPPYKSDFLTNYEIGWKTSWLNDKLRLNGAIYHANWDDFQFSFLGENGLTNLTNASGAKLEGVEMDLQWAVTSSFSLYGGLALQRSELTKDFCLNLGTDGKPLPEELCVDDQDPPQPTPFTPAGTRLPSTPKFKGSLTGRYEFPMAGTDGHFQASVIHEGSKRTALLDVVIDVLRDSDAYTLVDLSFGIEKDKWSTELFVKNAFDERAKLYNYSECSVDTCGGIVYSIMNQPRTIGVRFAQKF
jgi:outer membrane receptor protein involved in Fe transport